MTVDGDRRPWPDWLCRAMGGLDAAVFAALPLFVWFAVLGVLRDRFWWAGFNLSAYPFFGDRVFSMGLSGATLIGASFLLFIYGGLGFLMGLWFRPDSAWGVMVRALILGMAWHFFADRYFWNWVSPYSASYFSARLILPGHLLWALFLLRYQSRYEAVSRTFGEASRWPEPVQEEPEAFQEQPEPAGPQPVGLEPDGATTEVPGAEPETEPAGESSPAAVSAPEPPEAAGEKARDS